MKTFYKTLLLLIHNSTFIIYHSFSQQAPGIEWQNTIGGSDYDYFYSIKQTIDGGYIAAGTSNSNISGDKTENSLGDDYWLLKLDNLGNIQWQNTIGGNSYDDLSSVRQTDDGGYIVGGTSSSDISGDKTENSLGGYDYWILKLNSSGNIEWQNTIGGNADDYLKSIEQTSDKGYILGGYSKSNISGDKNENNQDTSLITPDYWIIKTDSLGNIQWQNTIGGNLDDLLYSIDQTSDGGYILGGFSWSDISGDKTENSWGGSKDYWVVKLDTTGNIQWQNTIGGDSEDELYSIQQTADGGYILGGYSGSNISGDKTENCWGSWDYWPVKLDMTGNIQWQSTIGGNDDDRSYSIQQSADGGYILGGSSWSDISGNKTESSLGLIDYWVVKINNSGTIQWQNALGGDLGDEFYSLQQTFDGGYILGGSSMSNMSGDKIEDCLGFLDYWIIKLLPDTITGISNFQFSNSNFQIFPNPSSGIFQISFPNERTNCTLKVLNTLGQKVFESSIFNHKSSIALDLSFLPTGIYVLKVNDSTTISSSKLIIE